MSPAEAPHGEVPASAGTGRSVPVLQLEGIEKRFGAVHALRNVDLRIFPGEAVSLAGENGAGKSTLSHVASGVLVPDEGRILIDGKPVSFAGPADADAAGVRIVPQELLMCPDLSVAENVSLGHMPVGRGRRLDRKAMRRVARERLARLGLDLIDVDMSIEQLSVAERALVQIARAMTPGTRLLIVDEPTAPLSQAEAERLLQVIQSILTEGVAVIYVSHRLEELFQISDRIVVMRDGSQVADIVRADLTHEKLVTAMVGGRSLETGVRSETPGGEPVLELAGLTAGVLEDVSLTVRAGEIVGVYGIRGSGRDELGPALFGAVTRTAGEVRVHGKPVPPRIAGAIEAGIGYVPAERRSQGLVLDMSVRENVTLSALDHLVTGGRLSRARERELASHWVDRLQLATPSVEAPVRTLSGGTQQKVLLARWLAANSCVLALDEPTRGVDVASKAEIYRLLRALADEGTAVLLISSDVEEIEVATDRALVMRGGRIATEVTEVKQAALLHAAIADGVPA